MSKTPKSSKRMGKLGETKKEAAALLALQSFRLEVDKRNKIARICGLGLAGLLVWVQLVVLYSISH